MADCCAKKRRFPQVEGNGAKSQIPTGLQAIHERGLVSQDISYQR